MLKFFSFCATSVIAVLNVNTAMVLVSGEWDHIKILSALPISFIACLLFDHTVAEEYSRERLRKFAESTLQWINSQRQRLSESPLGRIRLDQYLYLYELFEAPLLQPSKISVVNRIWCSIYLITEFIVGVYLLKEREFKLPWLVMIAPILAGLLNLATGLLRGHLIVYPKSLVQLRNKYEEYQENI